MSTRYGTSTRVELYGEALAAVVAIVLGLVKLRRIAAVFS